MDINTEFKQAAELFSCSKLIESDEARSRVLNVAQKLLDDVEFRRVSLEHKEQIDAIKGEIDEH